jgi:hypothetical protein
MIFVKETRPVIVRDFPEITALEIMQKVGQQWQSLDDKGKKYFQQKADNDKFRYLEETRKFHDEVAKIGDQANQANNDIGLGDNVGMRSQFSGKKRAADQNTAQLAN